MAAARAFLSPSNELQGMAGPIQQKTRYLAAIYSTWEKELRCDGITRTTDYWIPQRCLYSKQVKELLRRSHDDQPTCWSLGHLSSYSAPWLNYAYSQRSLYVHILAYRNPVLTLFRGHVQRFCGEAGVKLAKVDKLFLTGTGAEEHAGLSGVILTLSALGSPALEVFGPTGVDKLVVRELGIRNVTSVSLLIVARDT